MKRPLALPGADSFVLITVDDVDPVDTLKTAFEKNPSVTVLMEMREPTAEQKAAYTETCRQLFTNIAADKESGTPDLSKTIILTGNAAGATLPSPLTKRLDTPLIFVPLSEESKEKLREHIAKRSKPEPKP